MNWVDLNYINCPILYFVCEFFVGYFYVHMLTLQMASELLSLHINKYELNWIFIIVFIIILFKLLYKWSYIQGYIRYNYYFHNSLSYYFRLFCYFLTFSRVLCNSNLFLYYTSASCCIESSLFVAPFRL
jgi:hypothetical protein